MEQRDLLKDQIEQLGKVLGRILSDFLGLKSAGKADLGIEITNQRLQSELDIDIEKLTALSKSALKEYLANHKLTAEHLEILADYLKEIGIEKLKENPLTARVWLEKAIELIDIADELSETKSYDRINKKNELIDLLK